MQQHLRKRPIIREQDEALTRGVEPAHWKEPLTARDQVEDGAPGVWILSRGHDASGLVEEVVPGMARAPDTFSVNGDAIVSGIGARAELAHDLAVDAHSPAADELLACATRRDARRR
jgi:hypothetical protein